LLAGSTLYDCWLENWCDLRIIFLRFWEAAVLGGERDGIWMTEAFLREQYSPALFYPEFSPVDF